MDGGRDAKTMLTALENQVRVVRMRSLEVSDVVGMLCHPLAHLRGIPGGDLLHAAADSSSISAW